MSWVYLQHHTTVEAFNGVKMCGSKFLANVRKLCQNQHCTIPRKTYRQCETPAAPAVMISEVLLHQSSIMAACVHSHSNLFSEVSPGLPTYNNHNVTQFTVCAVRPFPVYPLRLLPKASNWQHKTVHFNLLMPHCKWS
jgi:hypothetical protein